MRERHLSPTFVVCLTFVVFNVCTWISIRRSSIREETTEDAPLPVLAPPPRLATRAEFQAGVSRPYFDRMGESDLRARGFISGREGYLTHIASMEDHAPTEPGIRRLFDLARRADTMCARVAHARGPAVESGELLAVLPSIPWRFVVLDGKMEGGMPHTQGGMVCLPTPFLRGGDDAGLLKTLIHEKIHVLQRLLPDLWAGTLASLGYSVHLCRADLPGQITKAARSNPDLDGYVYKRPGRCATVYTLPSSSLSQTRSCCADGSAEPVDDYEHPNERVAYRLSEAVMAWTEP